MSRCGVSKGLFLKKTHGRYFATAKLELDAVASAKPAPASPLSLQAAAELAVDEMVEEVVEEVAEEVVAEEVPYDLQFADAAGSVASQEDEQLLAAALGVDEMVRSLARTADDEMRSDLQRLYRRERLFATFVGV